jgi:hypothetical protein
MRGSEGGTYFNQKGQKVGKQANIGKMSGGFIQPDMKVSGNVHQTGRDIVMGDRLEAGRDIHKSNQNLKRLFEDVLERVAALPDEEQRVVKPVVESIQDQVNEIQQNGIEDETSPKYTALEKSLKTLVDWVPDIADVVLGFLQNPATELFRECGRSPRDSRRKWTGNKTGANGMSQLAISDCKTGNWMELSCLLNRVEPVGLRSVAGWSLVNREVHFRSGIFIKLDFGLTYWQSTG